MNKLCIGVGCCTCHGQLLLLASIVGMSIRVGMSKIVIGSKMHTNCIKASIGESQISLLLKCSFCIIINMNL